MSFCCASSWSINITFATWFIIASILLNKPELHHYGFQLRKVKLTWSVSESNANLAETRHCVSALVRFSPEWECYANMFAFTRMKNLMCLHKDKDWLSVKSHYFRFLHPVYLARSESCCIGNIRIIFGCHCLRYYCFGKFYPVVFLTGSYTAARGILSGACLGMTQHRQFKTGENEWGYWSLCFVWPHPLPFTPLPR